MSAVRYTPGGDWLSVVRGGVVVLLPATTGQDVLDRLWTQLGEDPDLQTILPIVTGGFGAGLASMPPFGLVSNTGRQHVLLRGPLRLRTESADGVVELSGEHVTTWTERIIDGGADSFTLSAGSSEVSSEEDGLVLFLESGIVRAQAITGGPVEEGVGSSGIDSHPSGRSTGQNSGTTTTTAGRPSRDSTPRGVKSAPASGDRPSASGWESADPDPETAGTGALEAEESATINPSLYLTAHDDEQHDDEQLETGDRTGSDTQTGSGAVSAPSGSLSEGLTGAEADSELSTTGYDHLWDRTIVRRVEDAAVRSSDEDDPDGGPGTLDSNSTDAGTVAAPQPTDDGADSPAGPAAPTAALPAAQPTVQGEGAASSSGVGESGTREPDADQSGAGQSPHGGNAPASGLLIDSVPWARPKPEESPQAQEILPPAQEAPPSAREVLPPTGGASNAGEDPDHDGQTVMRSDLRDQTNTAQAQAPDVPETRPGTGPLVLARLCAQGHANPPEASACGVCSQALETDPREVHRPSLGIMRVSTGEVVELDQSLIIGRQPSVSRVQGRGMPKLVQVTSAGGDISRSHVEVRLDGWHVLLCDLKATNGTVLIRSGHPPRRLGEGETAFLLDGDVAQLGDEIFLRFEGLR
ncbi:hypothetical protein BJ994_000904 [Arthrobacter pigmenti]|uniref:FHA domain-containing protein n=1 Tax=Arthrobacter pigmenti TaxID=271432 RepID=A0A846RF90_9MICC|nr:hypothetical protein [Arthrobacter pigmenti]NJC21828.1 hypothetical protein [Arthrobacter pigmenti]